MMADIANHSGCIGSDIAGGSKMRMHAERGGSLIEFDGATVTILRSMPLKVRAIQRFELLLGGNNVR